MDATIWPFAALRITTPRLELRYPDDDDLVALAHLAAEGIHDPACDAVLRAVDRVESPELERNVLQHGWGRRASLARDDWSLPFAVCVDGDPVGVSRTSSRSSSRSAGRSRPDHGSCSVRRAAGSAPRCAPRCCTSRSPASARRKRSAARSSTTLRRPRSADTAATRPMARRSWNARASRRACSGGC